MNATDVPEPYRLVEESHGIGQVVWREHVYADVPYRIRRFQGMSRSGLPIPGLHRIEGEIDLCQVSEAAELVNSDLTLELHDGRTLRVTLADAEGRVLAEGHGPSRCSCC